ncbi:MAG: hypothetical protein RL092_807 [Bacteroidota bacterium]|jgi:uncharacterized membrane protein YgdD (TMEM256/DUF423 family)
MKDSFFRKSLLAGGILMLTGVAFGAFGAHALKPKLDSYSLDIFEKGVFYQFIHALGLILVAVAVKGTALKWVFRCFVWGVFFFSFSLYLLSVREYLPENLVRIIGPITPVGGVLFILGWIVFLKQVYTKTIFVQNENHE